MPAQVVSNITFGGANHDEIFCTTGTPSGRRASEYAHGSPAATLTTTVAGLTTSAISAWTSGIAAVREGKAAAASPAIGLRASRPRST